MSISILWACSGVTCKLSLKAAIVCFRHEDSGNCADDELGGTWLSSWQYFLSKSSDTHKSSPWTHSKKVGNQLEAVSRRWEVLYVFSPSLIWLGIIMFLKHCIWHTECFVIGWIYLHSWDVTGTASSSSSIPCAICAENHFGVMSVSAWSTADTWVQLAERLQKQDKTMIAIGAKADAIAIYTCTHLAAQGQIAFRTAVRSFGWCSKMYTVLFDPSLKHWQQIKRASWPEA